MYEPVIRREYVGCLANGAYLYGIVSEHTVTETDTQALLTVYRVSATAYEIVTRKEGIRRYQVSAGRMRYQQRVFALLFLSWLKLPDWPVLKRAGHFVSKHCLSEHTFTKEALAPYQFFIEYHPHSGTAS